MSNLRQRCWQRALIEILNAERSSDDTEGDKAPDDTLAKVHESVLQDPANPLRALAAPSLPAGARR